MGPMWTQRPDLPSLSLSEKTGYPQTDLLPLSDLTLR